MQLHQVLPEIRHLSSLTSYNIVNSQSYTHIGAVLHEQVASVETANKRYLYEFSMAWLYHEYTSGGRASTSRNALAPADPRGVICAANH